MRPGSFTVSAAGGRVLVFTDRYKDYYEEKETYGGCGDSLDDWQYLDASPPLPSYSNPQSPLLFQRARPLP